MGYCVLSCPCVDHVEEMKFFACKALNWGNNDWPVGMEGYCVMVTEGDQAGLIKWFPPDLFYAVFGGDGLC